MSGILGALAGAADSASGILGQKIKEDADARMRNQQASIEERLQAAKEARMEQAQIRAAEHKQQMAGKRAQDITARSSGILGSEPVMSIEGDSGDMVAKGSIPNQGSEIDRLRARSKAAEDLGYMDEAKETRGMLSEERKFSSDEARDRNTMDANILREKIAATKDENDKKRLEIMLAAVLNKGGKEDKTIQALDEDGNLRAPTAADLNDPMKKFRPVSSIETDRKTAANEEAAKAKTAAQITKEIKDLQESLISLPSAENAKKRTGYSGPTKESTQAKIDSLRAVKDGKQGIGTAPTPTAAGPWSKYGSGK